MYIPNNYLIIIIREHKAIDEKNYIKMRLNASSSSMFLAKEAVRKWENDNEGLECSL